MADPASEMDTKEVAFQMASLKIALRELSRLGDRHYTGDDYLDPSLLAHLKEARLEFEESLEGLENEFPDVQPDYSAVDPKFMTSNVPDRSDEIDTSSVDPHHVSFAVALVRHSYRSWKKYCGNDTRIQTLSERINDEEQRLRSELTELDQGSDATWTWFKRNFERTYNLRTTWDFLHSIARDVIGVGQSYRGNPDLIAKAMASLANHNLETAHVAESLSTFSGRKNIVVGAEEWLDSLKGTGVEFQLDASINVNAEQYWFDFWNEIRKDQTCATYERLYVGVLLLTKRLPEPCMIGYVQLVFDFLVCECDNPLREEQALVVARLIQLLALIDHNDEGRLKVERNTVIAYRQLMEPINTSNFVHVEYLAACNRFTGGIPRAVQFHPKFPDNRRFNFQPGTHELVPVIVKGNAMIMINRKLKGNRRIVSMEDISVICTAEAGPGSRYHATDFWINVRGAEDNKAIEGEWDEGYEEFKAEIQRWFPGLSVTQRSES